MKTLTIQEIETAVNEGRTVYWLNEAYKVVPSGLNDGKFLIGFNIGGRNENYVGLVWEYEGKPCYKPVDFFMEDEEKFVIIIQRVNGNVTAKFPTLAKCHELREAGDLYVIINLHDMKLIECTF